MEFQKGPTPVTPEYRRDVAETLRLTRVTYSGLFDKSGTFDVVGLGEKADNYNTTSMWALNLLKFTREHGVRTTRDGFLVVYHGRQTRNRRDKIEPVHTIDPGNVRFVDEYYSFETKVTESGWVFNERAARRQRFGDDPISNERLEEILANAEAGIKPPFFDDLTEFVKVEPGLTGRTVHVIRFYGVNESVVVDIESRELIGKHTQDLLLSFINESHH